MAILIVLQDRINEWLDQGLRVSRPSRQTLHFILYTYLLFRSYFISFLTPEMLLKSYKVM